MFGMVAELSKRTTEKRVTEGVLETTSLLGNCLNLSQNEK